MVQVRLSTEGSIRVNMSHWRPPRIFIASPDLADAGQLVELGKTGVFLIRPDQPFEAAGIRAADRRALPNYMGIIISQYKDPY